METSHAIFIPDSLRHWLNRWWSLFGGGLPQSNAVAQAIHDGLSEPDAVKRALTRHHVNLSQPPGRNMFISLRDEMWRDVDAHQLKYDLPSRSEAVRELMRLGMGLPQPVVPANLGLAPSTTTPVARILQMSSEGYSLSQIAAEFGITRQRVSFILKQARSGQGAVGRVAAHWRDRNGAKSQSPEPR
jgi:DNA-binding NarL/FixJ family response regulator